MSMSPVYGIVPPLITPLTPAGNFDADSFVGLIDRVIAGAVHGLFLLGSTGEFCSLSSSVRQRVIAVGCRAAQNRVPVIVNVSGTSLDDSLQLTAYAAKSGAMGVALCPPYYFSITQADLLRYTQKFAEAAELPVFLYNIPQNARLEFEAETVHRLSSIPNIVGLKNSNGSLAYLAKVIQVKAQRPDFSLLVGTEEITLAAIDAGADGSICGGANMFPALYVKLFDAINTGSRAQAIKIQDLIGRIASQIYTVGPASTSYFRGIKAALAELGVCGETLAEPFSVFNQEEKAELRSRLDRLLTEIE
jgi:dihydrodipicolinate synthase/N-acetylneuraminate lyase